MHPDCQNSVPVIPQERLRILSLNFKGINFSGQKSAYIQGIAKGIKMKLSGHIELKQNMSYASR